MSNAITTTKMKLFFLHEWKVFFSFDFSRSVTFAFSIRRTSFSFLHSHVYSITKKAKMNFFRLIDRFILNIY